MRGVDKTIDDNKGLVYRQLRRFGLVDDTEAISIGYEALYNAIINYDETKGNALSTVATVYIYNALGTYVRTLNRKRQIQTVSYNAPTEDGEVLDLLKSETNIEKEYCHKEMCRCAMEAFNKLYDNLANDKHKLILGLWRESGFEASTVQLSKETGVSQSYVSQVINKYKHCLKKELEDMYYD